MAPRVRITPAEVVISTFGGVRPTARALGLTPPAVGYWRRTGSIPTKQIPRIVAAAQRLGVCLTSDDLVRGR